MYSRGISLPNNRKEKKYTKSQQRKHKGDNIVSQQAEEGEVKEGDWQVSVISSQAAKNANIVLVVYGSRNDSGSILLGSAGRNGMFSDGQQDDFRVNLSGVGKIYKIRLQLEATDSRKNPYWKPKEVKLRDLSTKEVLKFKCPHALSHTEELGVGACEIPAVRPGQPVLPVVSYVLQTHTADEPGADTDANVFVTIFGDRGDTGKRPLLFSDQEDKFLAGQVDTFTVNAVSVGPVKRLLLSHDGEGPGEGWKCDYVTVQEGNNDRALYVFNCNRWMDTSMEDGRIERLLQVKRSNQMQQKGDGRDRFFNRLTGEKHGGKQPFLFASDNSDLAFNRRFYSNRNKVQHAIPLRENTPRDDNRNFRPNSQNKSHGNDKGHTSSAKKMAGYAYLKLPQITTPSHFESDEDLEGESDSDVTLPPIDSAQPRVKVDSTYALSNKQHKPRKKSKQNSQPREQRKHRNNYQKSRLKDKAGNYDGNDSSEEENSLQSSGDERYEKNVRRRSRKTNKTRAHERSSIDKGIKEMLNFISANKTAKNSDLWSDVVPGDSPQNSHKGHESESDMTNSKAKDQRYNRDFSEDSGDDGHYLSDSNVSVYSTASGVKLLKQPTSGKHRTPGDSQFEPVGAVYIGSSTQAKPIKPSDRHTDNSLSPKKKTRHEKYNPLISKKSFPWLTPKQVSKNSENRNTPSPTKPLKKPKTAIVRPTKRAAEETDTMKEEQNKIEEEFDPLKYVPHRIEVRLAERRMRRRKRQENGIILPQRKSRLRKWSPKRPKSRTFTIDDREFEKEKGIRTAVDIRKARSRTFTLRERDILRREGVRTDVDIRKPKSRTIRKKDHVQNEGEAGDYSELPEEEVKLPSAIEQRIRARQLKKRNKPTTPPQQIIKPIQKKRKKRLRTPPKPKPLTVPVGPFSGASRIEERIKAKKEREDEKKRETEALLEKAKREKKKAKVVEMAPIGQSHASTYGEKYNVKKEGATNKADKNKPIGGRDSETLNTKPDDKHDGETDNRFNFTPPEEAINDKHDGQTDHNFNGYPNEENIEDHTNPDQAKGTREDNQEEQNHLQGILNKNNSSNKTQVNNASGSEVDDEHDVPARRRKVEFNLEQHTQGDFVPPPLLKFGEGKRIPSPKLSPQPQPAPEEPPRASPSPSPDFKPKGSKENPAPWAKRSYIHDDDRSKKQKDQSSGTNGGAGRGKKNWRKLRAVYYVGKNRFFHDYKSNIEYLGS